MSIKRILVVDDELHMIRVIKLLRGGGIQGRYCFNGQQALDSILLDPPDVLLTDINMPHMTGQQLCMALEKQLPERKFPIFVMTSMTDRENKEWTERIPNSAVLEKPVSMRVLIADLGKHFAQGASTVVERNG